MAKLAGAETINFEEKESTILEKLRGMTSGSGPKAAVSLGTDRPHASRAAIMGCKSGGAVAVPGVYGGVLVKIPFGTAMNKGLNFRTGQTHVNRGATDTGFKTGARDSLPVGGEPVVAFRVLRLPRQRGTDREKCK